MNTQELCLGVLHFCDASGYEIKQAFEQTFSHFQNPGFGSIYPALDKLQRAGLVNSRVEEQEKRPNKKVYSLTDSGREHFVKTLQKTQPNEVCKSDFIFLAFFGHLLDRTKFQDVMIQHQTNVETELEKLRAIEADENRPAGMQFTIDYGIDIKQAQLRFLKKHLQKVLDTHDKEHGD